MIDDNWQEQTVADAVSVNEHACMYWGGGGGAGTLIGRKMAHEEVKVKTRFSLICFSLPEYIKLLERLMLSGLLAAYVNTI